MSETPQEIDLAKARFHAAPEVQQCYYVTGEADFVLVVVVESPESEAKMRAMFDEIDGVLSGFPEVGAYDQRL